MVDAFYTQYIGTLIFASLFQFYCLDIILLVTVVLSVLLVQLLFIAKVLYVSLKYLISLRPFARICQLLVLCAIY